jgi:hypothetical protein
MNILFFLLITPCLAVAETLDQNNHNKTTTTTPSTTITTTTANNSLVDPDSITKYSFGGVFQICDPINTELGDFCNTLNQPNPLSGIYNCPELYEPYLLRQTVITNYIPKEICHDPIDHLPNCTTSLILSKAEYTTYWCAKDQKNGALPPYFGGVYSPTVNNIVTSYKSCPPGFVDIPLLLDLHVCLGADQTYANYRLDFGGFFSCTNEHASLFGNYSCPYGYTQYMATVDQGCLINYCASPPSGEERKLLMAEQDLMEQLLSSEQTTKTYPKVERGNFSTAMLIFCAVVLIAILIVLLNIYWKNLQTKRQSVLEDEQKLLDKI